jgi:NADH-quinone oxidoreductase subunit H
MKFALFFLAEYANMVVLSAFATTLFLGGYMAPWPISLIGDNYFNSGWWPVLWFFGKMFVLLFGFIWLRATLPRFRYDQFMKLGWKVLVPANLVWIVAVVAVRAFRNEQDVSTGQWVFWIGAGVLVLILLALLLPDRKVEDDEERVPITGGGYPVPPLDLEIPQPPKRKAVRRGRERRARATVGGTSRATGEEKETTDGHV